MHKATTFIGISSFALLVVILIQVFWIFRTAKIKEEVFNEKARIVLAKTSEAVSLDKNSISPNGLYVDEANKHKVDSILNCYLKIYGLDMKYSFEIAPGTKMIGIPNPVFSDKINQEGEYQACMEAVPSGNNIYTLKVSFPNKTQFILAEMGIPFVLSVMLILIVLIISWRTLISLQKEKRISEHTNQFLNNMTHEFKTPLTNIALAGKMLTKENNVGEKEKVRYYSDIILEENEKLRLQVEQVLSISALERGDVPLSKHPVDMHHLIIQATRLMGLQVENSGGSFELDLQASEFAVHGDKDHLLNIICNLIDNAIKYTQGIPLIKIATLNQGKDLVITITDNGIGIEKEYHSRLFDKYFRVPTGDVHDVKGFGLGLAYVKHIIHQHTGSVNVKSDTGKGSVFIIHLPYLEGKG